MDDRATDHRGDAWEKLRYEVLYDGLIDWVSVSLVHSDVLQCYPTTPLTERQLLTLDVIRSLVNEGLFDVGSLDTPDGRFAAFDEPLDVSIERIHDAYVTHHDDGLGWAYRYWLQITDKGKQVAQSTERGREVARDWADYVARRAWEPEKD